MKIVFFNIENLFLDNSHRFKSSPHKLKGLKRNIEYMNPDIMFLCEVGGMSTLKIFNEKHLDNAYTPILIEGNSDRGIELACLIKKDFKDEYKVSNYKDRPINFNYSFELMENEQAKHKNKTPPHLSHKFSRDVLQIDLFKKGNEKPYASFLYVHLKSKLDKDGIDPKGINRRKAEFNELLSIYKEIVKKNGDDYPVIVAGDFNGNASKLLTDDEFQSVYATTQLSDLLEILDVPTKERISFCYFDDAQRREDSQLDYCFIDKKFKKLIDLDNSGIYRFLNDKMIPYPLPQSTYERSSLPSDHYPIVLTINM